MAIHEESELILRLYELRREETMREARDWYAREFNPETMADVEAAFFSPNSGHFRMVVSYWDMAAALVNNGAISLQLFNETNGEQFVDEAARNMAVVVHLAHQRTDLDAGKLEKTVAKQRFVGSKGGQWRR